MTDQPAFICDAMLGGLARWLRAAGYDASFHYGIDDADLVKQALATGRVLLSSDGPLFRRNIIRTGRVKALLVPRMIGKRQPDKLDQLRFVLGELKLPLREPRCMACGGELAEVPKHAVMSEAPPLAYRNCDRFWRCQRCSKLLWHGTHWMRITKRLEGLRARE